MLKLLLGLVLALAAVLIGLNLWGALTLGTRTPAADAARDTSANRVVMVFGATGSVGDGLLEAVVEAPEVEKIYAVTRRLSPRLEAGRDAGRVEVILHKDFTDYSGLTPQLAEVNTVLWGLGTSSVGMDPDLYRRIHLDFPTAFVRSWLDARDGRGPMAFHYVTGMGTGEEESAQWAKDKGRAEREVAEMARGTGLRTFGHRSGWVRPTDANANWLVYLAEPLLVPGHLVIRGVDLGRAMLEISARTDELPNGAIIDNKDAIDYAAAYSPSPLSGYSRLECPAEALTAPATCRLGDGRVGFALQASAGSSLNTLTLTPIGLSVSNAAQQIELDGSAYLAELADLDSNGWPEVYVYVSSAGSGSYGSLVAYAVNNGKSATPIYLPDLADHETAREGYMGHDEFRVVENRLVRRYPVYLEADTNAAPTGGTRQLQYRLVAGEAGWRLEIDRIVEY